MKNFFYVLNKQYINSFLDSIFSIYNTNEKKSKIAFLQSIFIGINKLFNMLGARTVSKSDIPQENDYPDSVKFNKLVNSISFDIAKIYDAQHIIEDDINNLMKFNSNQRLRVADNLSAVQYDVYSAYIRSNKNIKGGIEIPGDNPFLTNTFGDGSSNISIDERSILTLSADSTKTKPIDYKNVMVYITGTKPPETFNMYPSNDFLYPGSHWKQSINDPHSIDVTNESAVSNYKSMLIDDPNSNTGIGFCEFEAVITSKSKDVDITEVLKDEIGKLYRKDKDLLYLDSQYSIQSQYIANDVLESSDFPVFNFKIIIPFSNTATITNEIDIEFMSNASKYMPKIDWDKSKVYSDSFGSNQAYTILKPNVDLPNTGKYKCIISDHIVPSRVELIVKYDDLLWKRIPFMMSHYIYSDFKKFDLPVLVGQSKIKFIFEKVYDIFVDSEANQDNEKKRALSVLSADIRS